MIFQPKYLFILLFLTITAAFSSCSKNNFDVDIADIELNNKLVRFDSLLFTDHPDSAVLNAGALLNKYPHFASLYFNKVIKVGDMQTKEFYNLLTLFLVEYDIRQAYEKSQEHFANFAPYKTKINDAFKHYKYYYPQASIPDIYLMISGFNQSVVVDEGLLAIALDKFLGEDTRLYSQLQIARFLRRRMTPNAMPYEVIRGWLSTEFAFNDSVPTLISHMIHQGKLVYMMDALFPQSKNFMKIGYTPTDVAWCEKSEKEVWLYMMDKKILFDTNPMLIRRFIEEAPFTAAFNKNSPGRVGQWMGWQIVKSYMKKNSNLTLQELMQNTDYHQILMQSGYNP